MQTHTTTVVQRVVRGVGGGGGEVIGPPRVFVTLRYFERFLPLMDSVYKKINIMGASDFIQHGGFFNIMLRSRAKAKAKLIKPIVCDIYC